MNKDIKLTKSLMNSQV